MGRIIYTFEIMMILYTNSLANTFSQICITAAAMTKQDLDVKIVN